MSYPGMSSLSRALLRGRAAAERLMVDACTVERAGSPTVDPSTGVVTPAYTASYSGKCKVQAAAGVSSVGNPDAGERQWSVQQLQVHLPVSAPAASVGDRITVTGSRFDPAIVGRVFTVTRLLHKSFATAQRLGVDEVTA
jgi:hypothetical protein